MVQVRDEVSVRFHGIFSGFRLRCRFCQTNFDTYIDNLCHELDVHVNLDHSSCGGCAHYVNQLLTHYKASHVLPLKSEPNDVVECGAVDAACAADNVEAVLGAGTRTTRLLPGGESSTVSPSGEETQLGQQIHLPDAPSSCQEAFKAPKLETLSETFINAHEPPMRKIVRKLSTATKGHVIPKERYEAVLNCISSLGQVSVEGVQLQLDNFDNFDDTGDVALDFQDIVEDEHSDLHQGAEKSLRFLSASFDTVVPTLGVPGSAEKTVKQEGMSHLCDVCALGFKNNAGLVAHKRYVHGEIRYRCMRCENAYDSRSGIIRHVSWARYGKYFLCRRHCGAMFATKEERLVHMEEAHKKLKCRQCDAEYTTSMALEQHVYEAHPKDVEPGTLKCAVCHEDKFVNTMEHRSHEKRCRIRCCGRPPGESTSTAAVDEEDDLWLPSEERKGKRKPTRQKIWGERFTGLQVPNKLACKHCRLKHRTVTEREVHETTFHRLKKDGSMVHICPYCPERFDTVYKYRTHLKIHPEIETFPCPHCRKEFTFPSTLSAHMRRIHRQIKYNCRLCEASFKMRYQLNDHMAEHEGKPRHKCPDCFSEFYKLPTFMDHKKYYCKVARGLKAALSRDS